MGWSPQPVVIGRPLWLCGEGGDMVMHWADPSCCLLSGETTELPRLESYLGRGVSTQQQCNPPTRWHWLDSAPKDTAAAGGSIQSGPRLSQWWSLLGSGICCCGPLQSHCSTASGIHFNSVGMGNSFPFWCCSRIEAWFVHVFQPRWAAQRCLGSDKSLNPADLQPQIKHCQPSLLACFVPSHFVGLAEGW